MIIKSWMILYFLWPYQTNNEEIKMIQPWCWLIFSFKKCFIHRFCWKLTFSKRKLKRSVVKGKVDDDSFVKMRQKKPFNLLCAQTPPINLTITWGLNQKLFWPIIGLIQGYEKIYWNFDQICMLYFQNLEWFPIKTVTIWVIMIHGRAHLSLLHIF